MDLDSETLWRNYTREKIIIYQHDSRDLTWAHRLPGSWKIYTPQLHPHSSPRQENRSHLEWLVNPHGLPFDSN
jgi:hypothetical protein